MQILSLGDSTEYNYTESLRHKYTDFVFPTVGQ